MPKPLDDGVIGSYAGRSIRDHIGGNVMSNLASLGLILLLLYMFSCMREDLRFMLYQKVIYPTSQYNDNLKYQRIKISTLISKNHGVSIQSNASDNG